jgi:small-conductance mechanosensitive channel
MHAKHHPTEDFRMKDDERKIVISKISEYRQTESPFNQGMPRSPVNRWVAILVFIPVLIVMAVLGAFFFAAFLALFVVAAGVFGVRLWWLRRKLRTGTYTQAEEEREREGDSVIIEDAQIVEETKTEHKKNI